MPVAALTAEHLAIRYATSMGSGLAVDDVSLTLHRGRITGLIGESGSGKSTVARCFIGLLHRNARVERGRLLLEDLEVANPAVNRLPQHRGRDITIIFQNALSSLNPLRTVRAHVREVMRRAGREWSEAAVIELFEDLGLTDCHRILRSYPHELSGGMRQRIAIALATLPDPSVVIADECTTAVDVTTEAEVVKLLEDLARSRDIALLFITHNILLATELCDEIAVMYAGQLVEIAPTEQLLQRAHHPYTKALLAVTPGWRPRQPLVAIEGEPPALIGPRQTGCRFASRCPLAIDQCRAQDIPWYAHGPVHGCRCIRAHDEGAADS